MRDNGNTTEEEEEEMEELDMIEEEERRRGHANRGLRDEKDLDKNSADFGEETPVDKEVGSGFSREN